MNIVLFRIFETKWGSRERGESLCFVVWIMIYMYDGGFWCSNFKAAFTVTIVKYIKLRYTSHAASVLSSFFHESEINSCSYLCRISCGLNRSSEYGMGMNSVKKQYFDPQDFELE